MLLDNKQKAFLKSMGLPSDNLSYEEMENIVDAMALEISAEENIDMANSVITSITTSKEWLE